MVPYVLQLIGLGAVWVSVHCVGMCGPIVAGLNAAHGKSAEESGWVRAGTLNVLSYQLGRAVTYGLLGAAAGFLGESIDGLVSGVGNVVALAAGGLLVAGGTARLAGLDLSVGGDAGVDATGGSLGRAARKLTRLVGGRGRRRLAVFGAVMGFLPCMLMFWVLGLAASTGSPAGGAGVMLGLVVLTTPVLVVAGNAPMAAGGAARRHGASIAAAALVVSGMWLLLVGAAANGWIAHLSYSFETHWGPLQIMFW